MTDRSRYIEESKVIVNTNNFDSSFEDNANDDESDVARLASVGDLEREAEDSYKNDENYCPIDS